MTSPQPARHEQEPNAAAGVEIDRALVASALQRIETLNLDHRAPEYERLCAELGSQLEAVIGSSPMLGAR